MSEVFDLPREFAGLIFNGKGYDSLRAEVLTPDRYWPYPTCSKLLFSE